jgi:hypothetical protein
MLLLRSRGTEEPFFCAFGFFPSNSFGPSIVIKNGSSKCVLYGSSAEGASESKLKPWQIGPKYCQIYYQSYSE